MSNIVTETALILRPTDSFHIGLCMNGFFQGIQVNEEFYRLLRELSELHPKLNVVHGGAGGAHGKADPRPKPMKVLKDYVKNNRMRLFDFFSMMDKDKSMSLTISEFADGLKETGIPLTSDELLELVNKLDKDNDGEINYRCDICVNPCLRIIVTKRSDLKL